MKKLWKIVLAASMFLLTSCASAKRYVAYTIYPIGYLLNQIGGNKIQTISIQNSQVVQLANIVDNYQTILEDSSYFFYLGGVEPYLDIYKDQIAKTGVTQIDLSHLNVIYDFKRYTPVSVNGSETFIESPYYDGEVFNTVDINEKDLSIWVDPIGMLAMANDIYNVLSANYIEQSAAFESNYRTLEANLIALDAEYQALAERLRKENSTIKFVTMLPNFGNWQKAYGFNIYPICLSKYGALPSDEQLAIIKQRIIADDVHYIAYDPNMSAEMAELFDELESELSLKRINLYNIACLTPSQLNDNKDYLSLMYENLNVLESIVTPKDEIPSPEEEVSEISNEEVPEEVYEQG